MPKGQKVCNNCGFRTGPRAITCPNCNTFFYSTKQQKTTRKCRCGKVLSGKGNICRNCKATRNKKKKGFKIDWRKLQPGDIIRVKGGPYWLLDNAEKENMGYIGFFRVKKITDSGIGAYSIDEKESGYCHIYMGDTKHTEYGMFLRPHKVRIYDPEFLPKKLREKVI